MTNPDVEVDPAKADYIREQLNYRESLFSRANTVMKLAGIDLKIKDKETQALTRVSRGIKLPCIDFDPYSAFASLKIIEYRRKNPVHDGLVSSSVSFPEILLGFFRRPIERKELFIDLYEKDPTGIPLSQRRELCRHLSRVMVLPLLAEGRQLSWPYERVLAEPPKTDQEIIAAYERDLPSLEKLGQHVSPLLRNMEVAVGAI